MVSAAEPNRDRQSAAVLAFPALYRNLTLYSWIAKDQRIHLALFEVDSVR